MRKDPQNGHISKREVNKKNPNINMSLRLWTKYVDSEFLDSQYRHVAVIVRETEIHKFRRNAKRSSQDKELASLGQ